MIVIEMLRPVVYSLFIKVALSENRTFKKSTGCKTGI